MNAKRIVLSAIVAALVVWGLTELFKWVLGDLLGAGNVARFSPAFAGAVLGILISVARQAMQKKREEMLPTQSQG